jgi:hypothetical protein
MSGAKNQNKMGREARELKRKMLRALLRRRFPNDHGVMHILEYVPEGYLDDILRETMLWDERSRRK